jgi:hypothetical protein
VSGGEESEKGGAASRCANCEQPLPAGATFCRACGTRVREPVTAPAAAKAGAFPAPTRERPQSPFDPPPPPDTGRSWTAAALIAVGLLAGGAIVALVLSGGGDDSKGQPAAASAGWQSQPQAGAPPAGGGAPASLESEVDPGRYVQAGSFRTVPGAETERRRLEGNGIDVAVLPSDEAQDLYPGFQVLLGGPFLSPTDERSLLRQLHQSGVPSAVGRDLTPARAVGSPSEIAGTWTGTLERTGTSRSGLNGTLPVTLRGIDGGVNATIDFTGMRCEVELSIDGRTSFALSYGQLQDCVGAGSWKLRPNGDELAVVLLPPDTDTIVLGTLQRR